MNRNEYLKAVLKSQTFQDDASEVATLQEKQKEVEGVLNEAFAGAEMLLCEGGSKAKGTMICANYDLDIIFYLAHDETIAGNSLAEIYESVRSVLSKHYLVDSSGKTALRLREQGDDGLSLHIDVIPGRFTDDTQTDAFLHQQNGEEQRLKTNLQVHIDHIKDSGLADTIKLVKYWRECYGFRLKTFILELLVVEILSPHSGKSLGELLIIFWERLRDEIDDIRIEDPANPTGNDLSEIFNNSKPQLTLAAESTLRTIEETGWEAVLGSIEPEDHRIDRDLLLSRLPQQQRERPQPKPWAG